MKRGKFCCILAAVFVFCAAGSFAVKYLSDNSYRVDEGLNRDGQEEEKNPKEENDKSNEENADVPADAEVYKADAEDIRAEEIIKSMTIEEKVGQLFIVRYPSNDTAAEESGKYNFGGYILFSRDFENQTPDSIRDVLKSCQQSSKVPMLMGVDEEGGTVNRVSLFSQFRSEPFKSPQQIFNESGIKGIEADAKEKCSLLKSLGINLNLAPVCDISTNPNDFIYDRSFGKSAEETAEYIKSVVSVMNNENMGCVLKHFPGYGNNSDTHTGIAYDNREYSNFEQQDFLPFEAGIKAGAGTVLVSHNVVNCMDTDYPASLSANVHKILREELGFEGVIMTDDLSMEAITDYVDNEEAAVLAVTAGNDMVCCSDYTVQIPAVINAVRSGRISESRIDESVMRILKWKIKLGII